MDAGSLRSLRELRQRNRLTIRRAKLRQVRVAGELLWSGELGSKFLSHQRSIFSRHLGSSAKKNLLGVVRREESLPSTAMEHAAGTSQVFAFSFCSCREKQAPAPSDIAIRAG